VRQETLDVAGVRIGKHTIQFSLWNKRNKFQWAVLVLYGSPYVELKDEFLAELSSCCNIIYIFGGYFNGISIFVPSGR
jgi:hypothetical protein